MIELDDCGKTITVNYVCPGNPLYNADVKVKMVIVAPRGRMVLFDVGKSRRNIRGELRIRSQRKLESDRCMAIKAFMEEHKDD